MRKRCRGGSDERRKLYRQREALVALVGITATRGKRQALRLFLESHTDLPVFVPWLPYFLGVRFCGWCLHWYLERKVLARRHQRIHLLAYIGGAFVLRSALERYAFPRFGRIVYDRCPIQEAVPAEILRRTPRLILLLTGFRSVIDLASRSLSELPFPRPELEQGLIIETEASAMARRLGLGRDSVSPLDWRHERLLPCAAEVKELALSHDDVYESEVFLSEALAFLETGHFRRSSPERQPPDD